MQKLTDQEFKEAAWISSAAMHPSELHSAMRKLLANYQEQLEIDSYGRIELQRYTEANTATTTLDVNIAALGKSRPALRGDTT